MRIGIISERAREANALHRTVSVDPAHHVIWTAHGDTCPVSLCAADTPDLILMGVPGTATQDGQVIRRIMAGSPCPILIVTDSVAGNAAAVFDAMGQGAFDVVDVPALASQNPETGAAVLLSRIVTVERLAGQKPRAATNGARRSTSARGTRADVLVAIGASAGGPAAVATVLKGLPEDLSAGVVIVQHVDDEFVAGIVKWLAEESGKPISLAVEGKQVCAGDIVVAGASAHLAVKADGRLGYTREPRDCAYQPSVDVFFHSAARHWPGAVIGVLLTGMGKDGAHGLKALRDSGHPTIAQDQTSSAVYGMPKAAAALNAAVDIRPLSRIAGRVTELISRSLAACPP